jgi:LacI family transcriptional regulator
MAKVTIGVLAQKLQLSTATVSKALTDSHEISEKTKKRVLAMAAELNYSPNPYASGLRHKKSGTIAVILPEVADSFFAQSIDGIESVARDKGYHVLIHLTHEKQQKEQSILKGLQGGRVDGVLLSVSSETDDPSHIQELLGKEIPLVFFDRVCEGVETAQVITDDFDSAYKATQHLIACGCRRIFLLSISTTLSISHQRLEGYKKALADHGTPLREADIVQCSHDPLANYLLLKEVMEGLDAPDGIIATVEKLVTVIYLVCKDLGRNIPRQVKVIGFSNLASAMLLDPSLTTITQPAFEMGRAAARLLFDRLTTKDPAPPRQRMVIPSTLIVRNSTAPSPYPTTPAPKIPTP